MWPFNLSVRLLIVDLVSRYPTNYLIRCELIFRRNSFDTKAMRPRYIIGHYHSFPKAIPVLKADCSHVTHPSATDSISKLIFTVRLACVRRAASVRPEPGSNSLKKLYKYHSFEWIVIKNSSLRILANYLVQNFIVFAWLFLFNKGIFKGFVLNV